MSDTELKWDFKINQLKECSVCHKNKAGVQMGVGYTNADFVCKDCISVYFNLVEAKLKDKIGEGGKLFKRLDEESKRISRIQEMASADYTYSGDVFKEVAEIYKTIFPNGITSGSPVEVGEYDGKTVKVGGSGIGRVISSWSNRARYSRETSQQIKIATKLWRRILPEISNYQDRAEKFKRFFSTLEKEIVESSLDPYNTSHSGRMRCETTFNTTLEYSGTKDDTLIVKKGSGSYGDASVSLSSSEFSSIPLDPPDDSVDKWLKLLPYMEEAFKNARELAEQREKDLTNIIESVEKSVKSWYTANSISI